MISAVTPQMGGNIMNSVKHYLIRLKRSVFHRGEELALEGGISFGPGSDPKGSFYSPQLSFYWYQPSSVSIMEEPEQEKRSLRGWFSKMGKLRRSV
jgi:hypothetical protein